MIRRTPARPQVFAIALCVLISMTPGVSAAESFPPAPEFSAERWINSGPLQIADLRGSVVLVEFWTYACWNCKNVEPYIRSWHETYAEEGLVVVAVHTPEFEFEKDYGNVRNYVRTRDLAYPVAIDNDFSTWKAYGNRAWPTVYLIDREGRIRYRHIGEGRYKETEKAIQALLGENSGGE